jgi:hypothetical protein
MSTTTDVPRCERRAVRKQGLGRKALGAAVAFGVTIVPAVALAAPASAHVPASGPRFQVVNTGGIGVALRSAPDTNAARSQGPGERAWFELLCQDWGSPVGGRANRVWNYIRWSGRVGWISDVYTNTPTSANQFLGSVPRCSAPAPRVNPQPVAPGSVLQPAGPVRPAAPTPPPAPAPTPGSRAANWARSYIGVTHARAEDHVRYTGWKPGPDYEWAGDCYGFASAAWYGMAEPHKGATAAESQKWYAANGRLSQGEPALGAIVFYDINGVREGHAGIYVGNNTVVSTDGMDRSGVAVSSHPLSGRVNANSTSTGYTYKGWVMP